MSKFDGSRPGPGRPKGSKNKLGQLARENIVAVFEGVGGAEAMVEWAKENRTEFYSRVYTRLLPSEAHVALDTGSAPRVEEMTDAELMAIIDGATGLSAEACK